MVSGDDGIGVIGDPSKTDGVGIGEMTPLRDVDGYHSLDAFFGFGVTCLNKYVFVSRAAKGVSRVSTGTYS